jgi:hypothetical protein
MMRNAKREDVSVRVRDTGGRRRSGGSGWDERSHLFRQLIKCHSGRVSNLPDSGRSGYESHHHPAGGANFLPAGTFLIIPSGESIFSSYPSVFVAQYRTFQLTYTNIDRANDSFTSTSRFKQYGLHQFLLQQHNVFAFCRTRKSTFTPPMSQSRN